MSTELGKLNTISDTENAFLNKNNIYPWASGIGKDVSAIRNTIEITTEDLKYLHDAREQEIINKVTSIRADLGSITQNVKSEADLDGIVTYLGEKLREEIAVSAEGAY